MPWPLDEDIRGREMIITGGGGALAPTGAMIITVAAPPAPTTGQGGITEAEAGATAQGGENTVQGDTDFFELRSL